MTSAHLLLILAPVCAGLVVCAFGWVRAEKRAARYWQLVRDDCETDENVRDLARPVIGRRLTDGDSYGVPPLEDIARGLIARTHRAEQACEELRKQVMRGSCIVKVPRYSTNAQADLLMEVVAIEGTYHAFTDSPLPRARELYAHLVSTQQIQPLPPIHK